MMVLKIAAMVAGLSSAEQSTTAAEAIARMRNDRTCARLEGLQALVEYRRAQSAPEGQPLGGGRELLATLPEPEGPLGKQWKQVALTIFGTVEMVIEDRQRSALTEAYELQAIHDHFCGLPPE